jgi:hypothetical protein
VVEYDGTSEWEDRHKDHRESSFRQKLKALV